MYLILYLSLNIQNISSTLQRKTKFKQKRLKNILNKFQDSKNLKDILIC